MRGVGGVRKVRTPELIGQILGLGFTILTPSSSSTTVPQPLYSPDLAPCDFWLYPKLRGCRYETIEEMKEAVTKVIDMLTQEDFHGALHKLFETVQQVHCSRRRLLRRELEFHVCTINKSANTKKVRKLM